MISITANGEMEREREREVLYHGRKKESCCVIEKKIERGMVVWERGRRKGEI